MPLEEKLISTKELAKLLAGGDSYVRTKNGVVKGLAITTKKNPEAPAIIVVGIGPRIESNARLLSETTSAVPVYIKQATNKWSYAGMYKFKNYLQDEKSIKKYCNYKNSNDVSGIIFLEQANNDLQNELKKSLNIGSKKKSEEAAINFVIEYYERQGYRVIDRQKENVGYDLLLEKNKVTVLKLEVKGTSTLNKKFFLTRNEKISSVSPNWRLVLVRDVLNKPIMDIYTKTDLEKKFFFDCLVWECNELK